jgi:hypothetical protein
MVYVRDYRNIPNFNHRCRFNGAKVQKMRFLPFPICRSAFGDIIAAMGGGWFLRLLSSVGAQRIDSTVNEFYINLCHLMEASRWMQRAYLFPYRAAVDSLLLTCQKMRYVEAQY